MKRFILYRSLPIVAISILYVNVICSQIFSINLTSEGTLLNVGIKTANGKIAINSDFTKAGGTENPHSVLYEHEKVKQIDDFPFYYLDDSKEKLQKVGKEEFSYYGDLDPDGFIGKLKEVSDLEIIYYTSGTNQGKIQRVNHHFLYYTNGKLNTETSFVENSILFWIHDSKARFDTIIANKKERDKATMNIIYGGFTDLFSSNPSSYPESNYFRVKKERQVLKFKGGKCFKILYDGHGPISSIPADCSLYSRNHMRVRDEIFVLKYDDKVCFRGELVGDEYLIFRQRKCPKGKERSRLIYQ